MDTDLGIEQNMPDAGETIALMRRAKDGDPDALADLLSKYQPWLQRVVHVKLGRDLRRYLDSVDIVQDALVVAYKKLAEADADSPAGIRAWLAGVASNVLRDKLDHYFALKRDVRRQVALGVPCEDDDGPRGAPEPAADITQPDERAWKKELRAILDDAVSQLPDHYREVVFLRDYAKADWEEIRKTLDKPSVPAAKQLHQRAWIEIRKIARPRLTDPGS